MPRRKPPEPLQLESCRTFSPSAGETFPEKAERAAFAIAPSGHAGYPVVVSRRPRFNPHRDRKFWSGLGVLLLLTGLWVAAGRFQAGLTFIHVTPENYGKASVFLSAGRLDFTGWFFPEKDRSILDAHRSFSTTLKKHREMKYGFIFRPESRGFHIAIPLWIPPLLWSAIWLRWMIRAARDEAKRWKNSGLT